MNILLTGKNGQLGFELQRSLAPLGRVFAVDSSDCDLEDSEAVRELVRRVQPQVVVNPAAFTAVDLAESHADKAMAVNAVAPGVLGEEAHRLGAPVIHFSTDYVFDGEKGAPYVEDDAPQPQSVYGRSKLLGEIALRHACPKYLILRTSWVFGAHGQNFAKTMLRLAQERSELRVVSDQIGAPTSAALLADLTAHLVRQLQQSDHASFPFGLYHVTASGETSWHAYARYVLEQATIKGYELRTSPDRVMPITTDAYPTLAKRPRDSRLDSSRFKRSFALELPHWEQGLNHILQQIL